ncbi:hypothetical protein [Microvirga yunnanensis]|uniref:hypothetical protein n=1 Tax=Microvirga yunnanensis TaxID=2953740 RepID=UPI0021C668F4|nr:hypothetical protein [Microvirga sp. HBU65207]
MRVLMALFMLVPALAPQVAQAQAAKEESKATTERVYNSEESAAMAAAVRKKAEAAERARDARLRRATRGICIGC